VRRDETKPAEMALPTWLANLETLLVEAEALADSEDMRAQGVAQRARFMRVRRPKGT
jgi:hypothetical protein